MPSKGWKVRLLSAQVVKTVVTQSGNRLEMLHSQRIHDFLIFPCQEELYHRLKTETIAKIAEVYPELDVECKRQAQE